MGIVVAGLALSCIPRPKGVETNPAGKTQQAPREEFDDKITENAKDLLERGRTIFRYDTFGSEAFWGGKLQLHHAILGQKQGGVGAGLTPNQALKAGLKADVARVPKLLVEVMREGARVSLDNPETTLELLRADAVVGVKRHLRQGQEPDQRRHHLRALPLDGGRLVHEGHRPPARRLAQPRPRRRRDRRAGARRSRRWRELLGVDEATVRKVLASLGAGQATTRS